MAVRSALACAFSCLVYLQPAWAETDACPTQAAFRDALGKLAPQREEGFDFEAAASSARVDDLGPSYRVSVGDRTRAYDDADRDCQRRARTAAVFVALVLWPADESETPEPEPIPPKPATPEAPPPKRKPVPAPEPKAPAPERAPRLWLEAGAGAELGTADSAPREGLARLLAEYRFHPHAGAVAYGGWPVLPATLQAGPVNTDLRRAPFGLGLRYGWSASGLRTSAEATLGGAWLRVKRRDGQGQDSALELGARVGAALGLDTRVTPVLSVQFEFVPSPRALALSPTGEVGRTPRAWFGATLGCAVGLW